MLGIHYDKGQRDITVASELSYSWAKEAGVTNEAGLRELLRRHPRAAEYEVAGRARLEAQRARAGKGGPAEPVGRGRQVVAAASSGRWTNPPGW
jgi:hypothetical protein